MLINYQQKIFKDVPFPISIGSVNRIGYLDSRSLEMAYRTMKKDGLKRRKKIISSSRILLVLSRIVIYSHIDSTWKKKNKKKIKDNFTRIPFKDRS